MPNDELLDFNNGAPESFNSSKHSSAKTFMIIMAVLWGLLLFVDLGFLMIFSFIFSVANAFSHSDLPMPLTITLLYWDLVLYPILMLVGLIGGFTSLGKHNYSAVYTYGLLPLISVILFFILLVMVPHEAAPTVTSF